MSEPAPRFICDVMLGRLAGSLRMLGLDTLYMRGPGMQELLDAAAGQNRILLTRRATTPKSPAGCPLIRIKSNDPEEQLRQVIAACGISQALCRPLTICLRCNAPLAALAGQDAAGRVPDYVHATAERFSACPSCGRVYWQGTHYAHMAGRILAILGR